ILNNADNINHQGCKKLLNAGYRFAFRIHETLNRGSFIERNRQGNLTVINGHFEPTRKDYKELNITFLDVSGEDCSVLEINHGEGQLPAHINIFLQLYNLPLLVILVVPYDPTVEGKSEGYTDRLMAQFLGAVDNRNRQQGLKKTRVILLITQWDKYTGRYKNDVNAFAREKLPATTALLNLERDLISEYSIGQVIQDNPPWIQSFNEEYPKRLWNRIYETFAGNGLDKKSWWQKLFE
ncbi:MAG: hypothetical protein WAX77_16105, partial [Methylococcaceae bacterium]